MPGMDEGELQRYILDTIARIDRASDCEPIPTNEYGERDEGCTAVEKRAAG